MDNVNQLSLGLQEPPNDYRIFNRKVNGKYRPLSEYFDKCVSDSVSIQIAYCEKIGNAVNAYTVYAVDENGNCNIIFQGSKKGVADMAEKYNYEVKYIDC